MKKVLALLMAALLCLGMFACQPAAEESVQESVEESKAPTYAEIIAGIGDCMDHAAFEAAAVDDAVKVLMYVQDTQSWWNDSIVVYGQAPDGGYLCYNLTCSEADAAKLVAGTAILVEGYKAEYAGEVEIGSGATFSFYDTDPWIAEATDVTALYGTDKLDAHMNEKIAIKGAKVVAKDETGAAFYYKWNNAGQQGDDLYFDVEINGATYTLCVESYLRGADTDVYKAVEALKVGAEIDVEGFLYWYNGAQPHITSVNNKYAELVAGIDGCMDHAAFEAAAVDDAVKVLMYVQDTQSWWNDSIVVYGQAPDGGYLCYNLTCSEADAAKLVAGTAILVEGYKAEYSGEIEIGTGATFTFYDTDPWTAEATDVTAIYGTDKLDAHMNEKIAIKGAKVVAKDETGAAFYYKWNNAGQQGDDLYFDVEINGATYTLCVESYLRGSDTDVYKAVEALQVGDVISVEGFLYWYNGAQPHIITLTK